MRTTPRSALVMLAIVVVGAAFVAAQRDEADVRQRVAARFRVLPLSSGILLEPRDPDARYRAVQIGIDGIAVDGDLVTRRSLRARVGSDADLIVAVAEMGEDARRALAAAPAARPDALEVEADPRTDRSRTAPSTQPPPAGPAERRRVGGRFRMGRDIVVGAGEHATRDLVTVGGSIEVNGHADDDVVAIFGDVRIGPDAEIRGDVVSVGGEIVRASGARVYGQMTEVAPIRLLRGEWADWRWRGPGWGESWPVIRWMAFAGTIMRLALVAVCALLILLVAPRTVEDVRLRVRHETLLCGVAGLAAQILFLPALVLVVVLLAISIVGIPLLLAVPFALLGVFAAALVGLTGVAMSIGRSVQRTLGWRASAGSALLMGLAAVFMWTMLARAAWISDAPVWPAATVLSLIAFVVEYLAWTVGIGGVILGWRRGGTQAWTRPSDVPPVPPHGAPEGHRAV